MAAIIFIAVFLVYCGNITSYMGATDTMPAALLPWHILNSSSPADVGVASVLSLDEYQPFFNDTGTWINASAFMSLNHGHYLSNYPIVTPVLLTPFYLPPFTVLKVLGTPLDLRDPLFLKAVFGCEKLYAAALAAIGAVVMFFALRRLFGPKIAVVGLIVYAFGTSTWTISGQALWQHGLAELLLAIVIFVIAGVPANPDGKRGVTKTTTIILGACSALLCFNRPTDAVFLLPIALFVFKSDDRNWVLYILSAALVAFPFYFYNLYYFGGPFGGYGVGTTVWENIPSTLAALLVSPSRGLLVYMPVAVLAIPGVAVMFKRDRLWAVWFGMIVATLVYYAGWPYWWAGGCYGPRFLTDLMPLLVVFACAAIDYITKVNRPKAKYILLVLATVLVVTSIAIQAIGALWYPSYGFEWGRGQAITLDNQSLLWDWHDTQIGRCFAWMGGTPPHGYSVDANGTVSVEAR